MNIHQLPLLAESFWEAGYPNEWTLHLLISNAPDTLGEVIMICEDIEMAQNTRDRVNDFAGFDTCIVFKLQVVGRRTQS